MRAVRQSRDGAAQRRLAPQGCLERAPRLRDVTEAAADVLGRVGDDERALAHPHRYPAQKPCRYASTASTRRWSVGAWGRSSFERMLCTCFSTAPTVSTS